MTEKKKETVDLICDACGKRGCVSLHSPLAEAIHARLPQDKVTEILCSKCSAMRRQEDMWTLSLGVEAE